MTSNILPRLIRLKNAPAYLGMDRKCFNRDVRPWTPEIRIGRQGIAFDREDLDQWIEEQKQLAMQKPIVRTKLSSSTRAEYVCQSKTINQQHYDFDQALKLVQKKCKAIK